MQILHRLSIASSSEVQREVAALGIAVPEHGLATFVVDENDSRWPSRHAWIAHRGAVDVASTTFTSQEIANAEWLELMPEWHCGYPQPEDDFAYRKVTYDLSNWCEQCGVGARQRALFRMSAEPKWGKRGILQLNWVFDEFFVTPEVWSTVFKPRDIECMSVLDRNGAKLKTVVQLVIAGEGSLDHRGLQSQPCPICRRTKYLPVSCGFFPPLVLKPKVAMAKTAEDFGDSAQATGHA